MLDQAVLNTLKSYLDQAHTITLVCGKDAGIDVLATTAVLAEVLRNLGKEVQLVSSKSLTSSIISGLEDAETSIGKQNLVISFPYQENAVDKVSYHIGEETGQFFLTIKPQKGHDPLDSKTVEFTYAGVESDVILLVGVTALEELDQLYDGYEEFYEKTAKISFSQNGSSLGDVNISAIGYSSLSECLLVMLNSMSYSFSTESATNMLSAIDVETDYMRSLKATAITFEAVAQLMRVGARRLRPQVSGAAANKATEVVSEGTEISVSKKTSEATVEKTEKSSRKFPKKRNKQTLKRSSQNDSKPGGLNYDPSKTSLSRN
ncbi:MAG: hypothetical protein H6773_04510 [Pseudomonadales bacterium]|nr:hypothetical protein [Candidatus Woesebacteria bacterium]MCB9801419.1 hypothetical protein [Pseudomonadales bacterium]